MKLKTKAWIESTYPKEHPMTKPPPPPLHCRYFPADYKEPAKLTRKLCS